MIETDSTIASLKLFGGAQIVIKRTSQEEEAKRARHEAENDPGVARVRLAGGAQMLVKNGAETYKVASADNGSVALEASSPVSFQAPPITPYPSSVQVEFQPSVAVVSVSNPSGSSIAEDPEAALRKLERLRMQLASSISAQDADLASRLSARIAELQAAFASRQYTQDAASKVTAPAAVGVDIRA
jgi:hypothetical protein